MVVFYIGLFITAIVILFFLTMRKGIIFNNISRIADNRLASSSDPLAFASLVSFSLRLIHNLRQLFLADFERDSRPLATLAAAVSWNASLSLLLLL